MNSSFERIIALIGTSNFNKLQDATVAVIGLGGVGGASLIALARSGVKKFVIVDFDKVAKSNINRQAFAHESTLSMYKTDVAERELLDINTEIKITKLTEAFNKDSSLFNYHFDYLIDCIDKVDDKLLLIKTCQEKNIPFISSMGTAKKMDIKKLEITKISKTSYDPLAKAIRRKMKEFNLRDFYCLASTEEPANIDVLGSYMPVTFTSGLMLADFVIKKIIE